MSKKKPAASIIPADTPATEAPHAAVKRSGEKITVACKLPHGLRLRLYDFVEQAENVMGGGSRMVKRSVQVGEDVVVKGVATPANRERELPGGYALTTGVDKEFFDAWMHQNREHDAVKNRLIFAAVTAERARDQAEEQAKVTSGLEPLRQDRPDDKPADRDPRTPRSANPNLTGIGSDNKKTEAA